MVDERRLILPALIAFAAISGPALPVLAQTAGLPDCSVIESYDWDRANQLKIDRDTGEVACNPLPIYEGGALPVGAVINSGIVYLGGVIIGVVADGSTSTSKTSN